MSRKSTNRPTDAELAILTVLWKNGPSTVREVHDVLPGDVAYTTALKLMQIMTDKGLVTRNESQRAHVYSAASSSEHTRGHLIEDLATRAFAGSASKLVMHALSAKGASPEDIARMRTLLDRLDEEEQ